MDNGRIMNRENLEKLAAYLEGGNLKARFDMITYAENGECYKDTCGSVGCAIGHGPYAEIPKNPSETWEEYCYRVFGISWLSKEWKFCFSASWQTVDNTPRGAAKRIRWLLSGKSIDCYEGIRPS